jgi:uncharacterized protein (DUF2236 family)
MWIPPTPTPAEAAVGLAAGVAGRAAAPLAQAAVQNEMAKLFRGHRRPAAAATAPPAGGGDPGWFGPASTTWRVHADMSMFVGGIAALMLQALHPRAMAGVADDSAFLTDPLGRLRRTAAFVGATAYGTSEEAARACAMVRRVHERVVGTTPDGRPYAANEPELIDWVHVAEFATFAAAHRRFGADPMSAEELDRYIDEVSRVALELGDPSPPRSWAELDAALGRHRPQLAVGEQARRAWRFLDEVRLPAPVAPAYRALFLGAVACLPPWARRLWGVRSPSTVEIAACRALVRGLGAVLGEPAGLNAARARALPPAA